MEEFYKKKIIRDFLTLFSESKWKNLCILCMEYGVLMLKQKYQISSLSMEDIEEFVNDLIEEENKKNQKNLKKLRKDIVSNTNFNYNNYSNINNTSASLKPSSEWRKGEIKTIFDGEDNNNNNNNYLNNQNFNNYNNNTNNYHYNQNNSNLNKNINNNFAIGNNYIDPTTYSNDEPALKGKEKLIDDILYPKQNKIVNYHKDNLFNNNLPKKQQLKQYRTSYNESYGIKKKNDFSDINSKYKNYNRNKNYGEYNNTSFTDNISFNNSKTLKRSSSFSNNNRFKSGLQKLKLNKPLQGQSNNDSMNSSFSVRNNYSNKINNIPSKIKSQVDADKKIYGLLKKNKGAKYY